MSEEDQYDLRLSDERAGEPQQEKPRRARHLRPTSEDDATEARQRENAAAPAHAVVTPETTEPLTPHVARVDSHERQASRIDSHAKRDQGVSFDVEPRNEDSFAVQEALSSLVSDTEVTEFVPAAQPVDQYVDQLVDQAIDQSIELPGRRKHSLLLVALVLLVLLTGGYLAGWYYFSQSFLPRTTLEGRDVSLQNIEDEAQAHAKSVEDYHLAVRGYELELDLTGADIQASYDAEACAQSLIEQQQPLSWPIGILSSHQLVVDNVFSYDESQLETLVQEAVDEHNKDALEPKDATVTYDEKKLHYVVEQEVEGTKLDADLIVASVREAVDAGESQLELDENALVKPAVTADDPAINAAADKVNACLDATQYLTLGGTTVIELGPKGLKRWVSLGDDLEVVFDKAACENWARGDLSTKFDTVGTTRSYTRPDGKQVVVSGGTYGWNLNGAQIAAQIAENVLAGTSSQVELSFKQEAASWVQGGQDWGSTYVDIDLTEQYVRFYDSGSLVWESACVTGKVTDGHATPTGVYYINSNMESGNVELRGEIDPETKEPEYISYVKYWMPFLDNGFALHDADWRGSFGGSIYYEDGSHGCVNLPPDRAASLWNLVHVGTPVVVHD